MVMAAHLSHAMGLIDAAFVQRLTGLIERAGLPIKGPVLTPDNCGPLFGAHVAGDKKSVAGDIQFVLIEGPGKRSCAVRHPKPWCAL
jgi:3-dehydroquinate synthase